MAEDTTPIATDAEPLSAVDQAWLRMDEPDNRMVITGVMLFDKMDLASLRQVVAERLVPVKRFRQRVVRPRNAPPRWENDPYFELDHHVQTLTLPEGHDEATLQAQVGRLMSEPLTLQRPMWRMWLVEDYRGEGSVMISRLHHAIGDGVALMMVLLSMTNLSDRAPETNDAEQSPFAALFHRDPAVREAAVESAGAVMPEVMSLMNRAGSALRVARTKAAIKASAALGKLTFRPPDPRTPFKGPLQTDKLVSWSRRIPLDDVRTIKGAFGGTINDILLAAMTGGLRRYLEGRHHPIDGLHFRAAVPVSLRKVDQLGDMGNRFGLVFLKLPIGIVDHHERLATLRQRMQTIKGSWEAGVALGIIDGMGRSPMAIQRLVMHTFGTKATAVMTNVPGPRQPLYLAGRRIRDLLFWVPQSGRLGLGISILSYDGAVRLGVTTDQGLVPDPQTIVDGFHQEVATMMAMARPQR